MLSTDPEGVYADAEWFFSRSYEAKVVSNRSRKEVLEVHSQKGHRRIPGKEQPSCSSNGQGDPSSP